MVFVKAKMRPDEAYLQGFRMDIVETKDGKVYLVGNGEVYRVAKTNVESGTAMTVPVKSAIVLENILEKYGKVGEEIPRNFVYDVEGYDV